VAPSATICVLTAGQANNCRAGEFEMSFSLNISADIAANDIILISVRLE